MRLLKTLMACIAIAFTCIAISPKFSRADDANAKADPPYGIAARIPWTTSHITGSPEAPLPFHTRRAFPKLTFQSPLDVAFAPGDDRVFVLEQHGKIFSFPNDDSCAKADLVFEVAKVQGLNKIPNCKGIGDVFGFTLHPQFRKNHYLYVCYNLDLLPPTRNHENGTRISRFTVSATEPPTIDPKTELILLTSTSGGHNGCCLKFGPDGNLYISLGDGADPDPPDVMNTGQDIGDLMSSILRIDVDHPTERKPYSIPADNPFVKMPKARPEVFAYGLRNPFRMSFDRQTGNLWVGDVGWELWESIVCAKSGSNFGWSIMEGPNPVHPDGKRGPTPITPPAIALSHAESASVTGGIVYHGTQFPELAGHYVFGDWQTQRLWAAKCDGDKLQPHRDIAMTDQRIVAFGEQANGELLIVDHQGGGLWRMARNETTRQSTDFPRRLSESGLFSDTKNQTPQAGVLPFSVNVAQWADGAKAQRWIALPGDSKVSWGNGVWGDDRPAWPKDSILARTFTLEMHPGDATTRKNIETQILHFDGKQWQGYTYAWNDRQTDADLVESKGTTKQYAIQDSTFPNGIRQQNWNFSSRAQCMTCHNPWSDFTLAFNPHQLDRNEKYGDITDNQVRNFRHLGFLVAPKPSAGPESKEKLTLTDPVDSSADLNERARSYLHVNCSHCHRFGGGGSALFDMRKELALDKMNLVNTKPNLGDFGLDEAQLICAGDPNRSVVLYRMAKLGRGRMPHIGSDRVDVEGLKLIRQWAQYLAGKNAVPTLNAATNQSQQTRAQLLKTLVKSKGSADAASATDGLLSSVTGAMILLEKVDEHALPQAITQAVTARGAATPLESIRDLFRRFDPADQQAIRLGTNIDPNTLLNLHGDIEKGRKIFAEQSGTGLCIRCHIVAGKGTDFGPDLSHIATKYVRKDLLDNILNPSKTIAEGYATYMLKTKSGEVFIGFLISRSDKEIVLKGADLKLIHIDANDVQKLTVQTISAMPDGLLGDLEQQQAVDLLEYLSTLK